MNFKELQQFDIDNSIYNSEEFAVTATLLSGKTVTLIRKKEESFGEVEHDLYNIRATERALLATDEVLTIDGKDLEVLSVEPDEESSSFEHTIAIRMENV